MRIKVTNRIGKPIPLNRAIREISNWITAKTKKGNKIIFIGNGGSASIASHIATDFLKNAEIPALAFNDPSLITCLSNDLGYEHVFEKPIEVSAGSGDILFAISSSGKSKNILQAVVMAKKKRLKVITLSGFQKDNPLRKLGETNFYIPSTNYGYVEILHLCVLHYLVDIMIIKTDFNKKGLL